MAPTLAQYKYEWNGSPTLSKVLDTVVFLHVCPRPVGLDLYLASPPSTFIYIIVWLFTPLKDIIVYCLSPHFQRCLSLPLHPEGGGWRTRQQ